MKRQVSLEEISDGRLYGLNDMVKADCGDCTGCSACCRNMGASIILDPYDICRLTNGLHTSFEALLADKLELNVVDGTILPNIKMQVQTGGCGFLDEEGRCTVHAIRPGICRLFPLGRYYGDETRGFQYILQIHECKKGSGSKVKVKKWIDTPDLKRYEAFVTDWHYFLEELQERVINAVEETLPREINLSLLKIFYMEPYTEEAFYTQFYDRLTAAKRY